MSNYANHAEEAAPATTDHAVGYRTAVAGGERKYLWSAIRALFKTYYDTLYAAVSHTHAQSDVTNLASDLSAKETPAGAQAKATAALVAANAYTDASLADFSGGAFISNTVFVDKAGNDTTGDGSSSAPFATVQKAYAQIAVNADASASKPYLVKVGPGVFSGATLAITPWVFLEGATALNSSVTNTLPSGAPVLGAGATRFNFDVHYHSSWATSGYAACGLSNFSLSDGKLIYLDLQTLAGTAGSMTFVNHCYTSNENGGAEGYVRWYGRGLADVVNINSVRSSGQMHIIDGTIRVQNLECVNGLSHGNSAISVSNVTIKDSIVLGNSQAQGNPSGDPTRAIFTYSGVLWGGTLTMSGDGQITTDVSSWPITSKVIASVSPFTITFKNDAGGLAYTPATPGDWAGTAPVSLQEAIDRLAAAASTPP